MVLVGLVRTDGVVNTRKRVSRRRDHVPPPPPRWWSSALRHYPTLPPQLEAGDVSDKELEKT